MVSASMIINTHTHTSLAIREYFWSGRAKRVHNIVKLIDKEWGIFNRRKKTRMVVIKERRLVEGRQKQEKEGNKKAGF